MEKPHSHTFRAIELNELNLCGSFAMQLFGSLQSGYIFMADLWLEREGILRCSEVVVGAFSGKIMPNPKKIEIF